MADPTTEAQEQAEPQAEAAVEGDFSALLKKEFRPKTDRAREAVEQAVQTLAEQVLCDTGVVSADVVKTIEALIGELDRTLSAQMNEVLHHEEFQKIEGAWRGGARFDLWSEHFNFILWEKAFAEAGLDLAQQAQKSFETDESLPWSHLGGPPENTLLKHYHQATFKGDKCREAGSSE